MHDPPLRQIVGVGVMLRHPVIPDSDIVRLPAPAHLKLRFSDMSKQEVQQRCALFSLTSTIRVVKPSLTNSACLPVTGWVRTTGCGGGGCFATASCQRRCSASVLLYLYSWNDLRKSCSACRPLSSCRKGSDSASQAAMPLVQRYPRRSSAALSPPEWRRRAACR